MFHVVFSKQAVKDAKKLKSAGLSEKAKRLVDVLERDPFQIPPSYEALVGSLAGYYSRRINLQHRLVYEVVDEPININDVSYEGTVKILRMWTHYEGL